MLVFLFALIVTAAGIGVFAHYNPGVMDVTLHTYRFNGVHDWMPIAIAAGVPLAVFFLYAIYASVRIRLLRSARARQASSTTTPLPAPSTTP
jgi:hypothetical protein